MLLLLLLLLLQVPWQQLSRASTAQQHPGGCWPEQQTSSFLQAAFKLCCQ
jgi:hypothetical protein